MKLMRCSGFPELYAQLGVYLPWVYMHSGIYETYAV